VESIIPLDILLLKITMKLGNMLTEKDIKKIIEANQEVFPTKGDFEDFREEMRKSFSDLQTSVDAYAKKADTYFQEMVALSHKGVAVWWLLLFYDIIILDPGPGCM